MVVMQGVNFASLETANTLRVMDGFSTAASPPFTSLIDLFHAIARFGKVSQQQEDKQQTPVSIVIDDLSALKWQFGADKVLAFVRCCKTLTHTDNGRVNVVVLSHADTASSSLSSSPFTSRSLVRGLFLYEENAPMKAHCLLRDVLPVFHSWLLVAFTLERGTA
jgi:hypothetical protein